MLLIYAPSISPRIDYAMKLFFGELAGTEFEITADVLRFQAHTGPKLNYSKQRLSDECYVRADGLLNEPGISPQTFESGGWNGLQTLFAHNKDSDLPFDPFAAAFYLVTRYEEYLPFTPDQYGRFPDRENTGVRMGFHEVPVVNHYAIGLQDLLQSKYPALRFHENSFQFGLTYDIDFAFAYRNKGILRNAGGILKAIVNTEWKNLQSRLSVLLSGQADPYDTYNFQFSLHEKFGLNPVYFFLLGNRSKHDRNIPWNKPHLQALIRKISDRFNTGIHCSFASNSQPSMVKTEIGRLESITGRKVTRNRQHFLRLTFPSTYQNLLRCGIAEDYTMGFASLVGFRAGVASPFSWYDLSKESITPLRIFPVTVMDATLHYYMMLSAEDAFEKTKSVLDATKRVKGYFQFLAHNDLLESSGSWKNWRENFEAVLALSQA